MTQQPPQPKIHTCPRCGFRTDSGIAMREHYLKQMRDYDPCKPAQSLR